MSNYPGNLIGTTTIQAHHGGHGHIRKGQTLRIVDVEGQQVAVCAWPEVVNGDQPTPLRFETCDAAT